MIESGNTVIETVRRIMEIIPEGVIISDLDNRVTFTNNALAVMLKKTPNIIVGTSFFDLLADGKEREKARVAEKDIGNACAIYDTAMHTLEGNRVAVRISSSVFIDRKTSTHRILRIITDITEVKRAKYLREQHQNLLTVYTRLLQHDLLNDLQILLGYIESVSVLVENLPPSAKDLLEAARSTGRRMAGIVQVFDSADTYKETNLIDLLEKVIAESKSAHMELNIELKVEDNSRPIVLATPLLANAFHNLFRNAAQHAGSPVIVTVTVKRLNGSVRIIIEDNGRGIPPEKAKTLFKRRKRTQKNGLGLYLTKHIIVACGGTIEVVPETDKGAKFKIILPILSY